MWFSCIFIGVNFTRGTPEFWVIFEDFSSYIRFSGELSGLTGSFLEEAEGDLWYYLSFFEKACRFRGEFLGVGNFAGNTILRGLRPFGGIFGTTGVSEGRRCGL